MEITKFSAPEGGEVHGEICFSLQPCTKKHHSGDLRYFAHQGSLVGSEAMVIIAHVQVLKHTDMG
jgi:hypothetical protein